MCELILPSQRRKTAVFPTRFYFFIVKLFLLLKNHVFSSIFFLFFFFIEGNNVVLLKFGSLTEAELIQLNTNFERCLHFNLFDMT